MYHLHISTPSAHLQISALWPSKVAIQPVTVGSFDCFQCQSPKPSWFRSAGRPCGWPFVSPTSRRRIGIWIIKCWLTRIFHGSCQPRFLKLFRCFFLEGAPTCVKKRSVGKVLIKCTQMFLYFLQKRILQK